MTKINTVKISRILNPTSIDLGEYVINPFMGCELSCLYCYVRSNKVISRKKEPWGTYVDVRVNAPKLLEKEILLKKPSCVLLGSTTECFQDIEKKFRVTKNILEVLNRYGVYFNILTRSPYILEYLPLLKKGFCRKIYFTVNDTDNNIKSFMEPKSAPYEERSETVNRLLDNGIDVTPYFSPILPYVSKIKGIFSKFPKSKSVEFEGLNLRVVNIEKIINTLTKVHPDLREKYIRLSSNKEFYLDFWRETEKNISIEAEKAKKSYNIYVHNFGGYFNNTYS